MLRGFRWQLIAFVLAAAVFAVSLVISLRNDGETPPAPEPSPTPVAQVAAATPASPTVPPAPTGAPATSAQPQNTNTSSPFREALVGEVQRLNPVFASLNPVDRDITSLIFEGLVKINEFGEPLPGLASDWIVSSNGLEYVVRLRDDVLWQDGIPFTAADVIYTMSILRAPDFPGAPELGAFWRTVETEQLGQQLVRFRLTQPLASFLDALRIGLLPAHALEGTPAAQLATHPFNLSPIGTGPYQLELLRTSEDNRIEAVTLRAAPVYRQRPEGQTDFGFERVHFRLYDTFEQALQALQTQEVDGLAARNRQERLQLLAANANIHSALEPTVGMLIFNWVDDDTSFFREQRVRQALETGLNRASIIERQLLNLAVMGDSPLLPGSWAYEPGQSATGYDPALAQLLLDTADIEADDETEETVDEAAPDVTDDGALLSFTILAPDDSALVNVAQEIAAQWSQYNLDVRVEAEAEAGYQARLEATEFDAAVVELSLAGSADPDVYTFWDQGQFPDGNNYGGVNDRRISEMLERARRDGNGINRAIHYANFQQEFIERAIAIPLYYPLYTYATARDIGNVQLGQLISTPPERFRTLRDWRRAPG